MKKLSEFSEEEIKLLYKNDSVSNKKNYIDKVLGEIQGRGYNKNPNPAIYLPKTKIAIDNARELDNGEDEYPNSVGTHVYKLIEKLIK